MSSDEQANEVTTANKANWLEQLGSDQRNLMLFEHDLAKLINKYGLENASGTPDHMLANFLVKQINVWNTYVPMRDRWHGMTHDRFGTPTPRTKIGEGK